MKKILAFLLSVIMVASMGVTSFSALEVDFGNVTGKGSTFDEASFDEASKDESSIDEASKDETVKDDTTQDEATFDEAYLRSLVMEFILKSVPEDVDIFADVDYSLDMIITHASEATADYAVFDLNFVCKHKNDEDACCEHENVFLNIEDVVYTNEINYYVSCWLGLGLYVVLPETQQVMLLEDALNNKLENLKELCLENGLGRRIGDADGDFLITVRDATYIRKLIAGLAEDTFYHSWGYIPSSEISIYDFDGNRKVDVRDATNLQKFIAGLPFGYDGNINITTTTVPETAEKLDCEIIKGNGVYDWERAEMYDYVHLFTSADEYAAAAFGEEDVYNEEYFEDNLLVFVHRVFGSGSFDYKVSEVFVCGDTLYVNTLFKGVTPGTAMTDDMNTIGVYIEIPRSVAPDVNRVVRFTDTCYFF